MAGSDSDEDKSHDPTQKRLDDARAKGDIARAPDLAAAAGYAGLFLASFGAGGWAISQMGTIGAAMLAHPRAEDATAAAFRMAVPAFPLLVLPGLAVLSLLVAVRGITVTGEKLAPRLSRINPVATAKHKFGPEGLAEFAKAAAKVMLIGLALVWLAQQTGAALLASALLDPRQVAVQLGAAIIWALGLAALVGLVIGLADLVWQNHRLRVRNRMSRKELTDETKESEGDPHVKSERRRKGQEIALNRMLADVPKADVVIVNPTHYAVALRWDRKARMAPVCVAKGVDEVALRIRARAAEAGVPIRQDAPTARAIHATVRLGEPIRPEHYRAVAAAIRFAQAMRRRARGVTA